jgi:hypothetical protein
MALKIAKHFVYISGISNVNYVLQNTATSPPPLFLKTLFLVLSENSLKVKTYLILADLLISCCWHVCWCVSIICWYVYQLTKALSINTAAAVNYILFSLYEEELSISYKLFHCNRLITNKYSLIYPPVPLLIFAFTLQNLTISDQRRERNCCMLYEV